MVWTVTLQGSRHRSRGAPFRPSVAKPRHVKRETRGGLGREGWRLCFLTSLRPSRQSQKTKQRNKGSGTPADAVPQPPHLAMRLAPCKARSPFGVPPRLSPKGIIPSQRLSFRPGFLGRGLHGRYPPSPVPVQGCTSRPGHSAGRLMPKPPGSEVYGLVRGHRPRSAAGEYPRPTASLLSETDPQAGNCIGDGCQGRCHCIYDAPSSGDCLPADNALGHSRRSRPHPAMSPIAPNNDQTRERSDGRKGPATAVMSRLQSQRRKKFHGTIIERGDAIVPDCDPRSWKRRA